MFYSYELLRRKGGKYAIIWLAATNNKKLAKRDFLNVNVVQTCEDVLRSITEKPDKSMRMSLYLSAQLTFGVVYVHHQQSVYLLSDASAFLCSLKSQSLLPATIDLPVKKGRRQAHTVSAVMPIDVFEAQWDEFGNGYFGTFPSPTPYIPSPTDFISIPSKSVSSADDEEAEAERIRREARFVAAHMSDITLMEEPPRQRVEEPVDEELGLFGPPGVPDLFILGMPTEPMDVGALSFLTSPERREAEERAAPSVVSGLGGVSGISEAMETDQHVPVVEPRETSFEEQFGTGLPVITVTESTRLEQLHTEPAVDRTPFVTAAAELEPTAPEKEPPAVPDVTRRPEPIVLEPVAPIAHHRVRRRMQKQFADEETMLSRDEMKYYQENYKELLCVPAASLRVDLAAVRRPTANQLLTQPNVYGCGSKVLLNLFRMNAYTRPSEDVDAFRDSIRMPPPPTKKSKASGRVVMRASSRTLTPVEQIREEQITEESIEHPRAAEDSGAVDFMIDESMHPVSEVGRESSLGGLEGISFGMPSGIEAPPLESIFEHIDEHPAGMEEQAEKGVEKVSKRKKREPCAEPEVVVFPDEPLPFTTETVPATCSQVERELRGLCGESGKTTFDNLCPPGRVSKAEAAKKFYLMLELLKNKKISVEQEQPFGKIHLVIGEVV